MGALLWFIAALVLACAELLIGDFTLLMLAGGGVAAAGISLLGAPIGVSVATFAVVSVGVLFFLRPMVRKRLLQSPTLDTSVRALVGTDAPVLENIQSTGGQIKLDGSIWSARSLDPSQTFVVGDTVKVVDIDGATAIVIRKES